MYIFLWMKAGFFVYQHTYFFSSRKETPEKKKKRKQTPHSSDEGSKSDRYDLNLIPDQTCTCNSKLKN